MKLPIRLIRWFNHAAPWVKPKRRLARWAARRLPADRGVQVYAGVQGRWKMRLDLANESQRWMYLNNYEPIPCRVLGRVLRPGDVCVDCGANVGYLSLWACRCVGPTGRVYAFEPVSPTVERLRENVRLNGVENIDVMANGTWDSPKTATMYSHDSADGGQASLGKRDDLPVGREFIIQTVRLDDVVDPPVRAIKIDVEGAELATLRGAEKLLTASRPHILMELNPLTCEPFGYQPIDLINWVLKRLPDYRTHLLTSRKCVPIGAEQLRDLLRDRPQKLRSVWLGPES